MDRLRLASRCLAALMLSVGSPATLAAPQETVTVRFTPSKVPLVNPERGFYRPARGDLSTLDTAFLKTAYRDGFRLIYVRIDLERWRTAALPPDYLTKLDTGFAAARRAGVKLIVRAVYNYPQGETGYRDAQDAPLPVVLQHLAQLKPVLHANADVIAFVQAGFIGAWGEWHTSSNGLTEPAARNAIRDALLASVPQERFVQFRYPPYIRQWTMPLQPSGRIGFHNDCFLASVTDVGSFSDDAQTRAVEQEHMDRLGDVAPFGGETCNPADDAGATPRTACADILREGPRYNLTYLNVAYYRRLFHDNWIAQGCDAEIEGRMGYRLGLLDAAHPARAARGATLAMRLTVRNDGWARPYNPRRVEIVLRNRASDTVLRLPAEGVDVRSWLPGTSRRVALDATLPRSMTAGTYAVALALPDPAPRLSADPRYAIRPANANDVATGQRWDEKLGVFDLGTELRVE